VQGSYVPQNSKLNFVLALVVVAAIATGALVWQGMRGPEMCQVCQRPVHAHSRTVAMIGGKKEVFCCPACALSQGLQSGQAVKILELTDYQTSQKVDPSQAYIVRGSGVTPCLAHGTHLGADGRPMQMEFDRCSPSLLAFATHDSAAAFAQQFGGQVVRADELTLRR
jgi:hypothetical protein